MNSKLSYQLRCKTSCLLALLVLLFTQIEARQGYQFENYTTSNGLSDDRITSIMKDRDGFMWIGTENGLNRFDGHSFLIYNPASRRHFISNPFVNDIEQDASGRLWVATQSGLNRIDLKKDSTKVFIPNQGPYNETADAIGSDLIWDVYIDKEQRIWMAADTRDLSYYDSKQNRFHFFPWEDYLAANFPDKVKSYNSIRKLYRKSDDELWLGTAVGLFSFTISTSRFYHYPSRQADHFIALEQFDDAVYFVQNPATSYELLSLQQHSTSSVEWSTIPFNTNTTIANSKSSCWLPAGKDLIEINTATQHATKISHYADDPYSLPDGVIKTIYRENNGLVWIGTSNGVGKFNPSQYIFKFSDVWTSQKEDPPFENDLYKIDLLVHSVFYSKLDNNYYISSPRNDCLLIMDALTGKQKKIYEINHIPLKDCSVIYEDSKGMLWILAGENAFEYDRKKKEFAISKFRSQPTNIFFTDMAEDAEGNYWFACLNDGLYRYNSYNKEFRRFSVDDEFSSNLPTSLYFDSLSNKMWIGTFNYGLYYYDFDKKRFRNFMADAGQKDSMQSSLITDVTGDETGKIWIASYATGLSLYAPDKNGDKFKHFTTVNGFAENNINSLRADRNGRVWITSFHGISSVDINNFSIKSYDHNSGLRFKDFQAPLSLSDNGEIYTGIGSGFISFHPDHLQTKTTSFNVVITALRTKKPEEIGLDMPGSGLTLPYNNNELEFEFAALSFFQPALTRYQYKLTGFDDNWVEAENRNNIKYNNLAPGKYTFRVKAADVTGRPSSNEATVTIQILPPWWKTWWFQLLMAATIVSIGIFIYQRRMRVIKTRVAIRLQMSELKEQALRAQMNPHFIFNSLNAISELIVTEKYTASYQYLLKFSKLLRSVLQLSEKNLIPLSNEIEMTRLYLELESLRFQHSFTYNISVPEKLDVETTLFPTMLLQPFIENAIWHGLLQKKGEKILNIDFNEVNGLLTCVIQDNGVGRKKAAEIKAHKLGSGQFESKAIAVAEKRMHTLKNLGIQHAVLYIVDSYNEDGTAAGTRVEIQISAAEK